MERGEGDFEVDCVGRGGGLDVVVLVEDGVLVQLDPGYCGHGF